MKNKIPIQLHNPSFRFFIARKNAKLPQERLWNSRNHYMFFEPKLLEYLNNGYNIGICCGFGSLIVVDFDDKDYQQLKEPLLPKTFTVRTAGKGLKHFYYILKGDMIRKIGINKKEICICKSYWNMNSKVENPCRVCDKKGNIITRIADIQAGKFGVVCPPSKINSRYYSVVEAKPIAEITKTQLTQIFNITNFKPVSNRQFKTEPQPELIQKAIDLFKLLGIKRTDNRHFKCPFHRSIGEKSLHIFPNGSLYCFNCQKAWDTYEHFVIYYYDKLGVK